MYDSSYPVVGILFPQLPDPVGSCVQPEQHTSPSGFWLTAGETSPIDAATVAVISGTVTFSGVAPKPVTIDMSNDPGCEGVTLSEQVLADDGRLGNVLVYVKDGLAGRNFAPPPHPLTVAQEGCRYIPHVAGILVGQRVQFVDEDQTLHNIHPNPKNNPEWNQSQMPNSTPVDKSQDPEIMMPIKCNQHPWMKMYLSVMSNPYFAVTGKDGRISLKGVPPGKYRIAAVHEKYGEQDQTIIVAPKQDKTGVDFGFKE